MKVVVLSDLHGSLININEKFDLMLICGDVCPAECHKSNFQKEWLNNEFVEWINYLPYKNEDSRVVMIAGNHDFYLESISNKKRKEWVDKTNGRLVYLDNEEYVFKGLKIFGCPYCKPLPRWAFTRDNLDKYYNFIPYDLDILLTHDAPTIGKYATTTVGSNAGRAFGCETLTDYVLDRKPKYHFFGHIHTGDHDLKEVNGIKMANVSILDEDYYVDYNPLILEL